MKENKRIEEILESINILENARSGDLDSNPDRALDFLLTSRGRYVITKAIMYGLIYMNSELPEYKEESDIADITYLVSNLQLTAGFYEFMEEEIDRNTKRRDYISKQLIDKLRGKYGR